VFSRSRFAAVVLFFELEAMYPSLRSSFERVDDAQASRYAGGSSGELAATELSM
jgi:hypothetical protein